MIQSLFDKARDYLGHDSFLRRWEGPMTEELVRSPSSFGLGELPQNLQPDTTLNSVCGFCSTGCSLKVHMKDGEAINLSPNTEYPVNDGMACPKGWEALTPLKALDRGTMPLVRNPLSGELEPVEWEVALSTFVDRFKDVQSKHGKESVAFISTGQIATEEMMFLGSLAKFGMGMKHGDGNTRQCMATSVVAYKQSFGFDAPPYSYSDFEKSDVLLFIGANPCIAHPIMWQRVLRNPDNPEIVVVDPRKTETAMAGTQHYPIMPKSDLFFLYGIAHILIEKGWIDRDYITANTNDFDAFAEHVKAFNPERVSSASGISIERLEELAELIHNGKRVSFWWTMGVNQSHEGTRTAQAIINLALMTGNIGRPGTGANSITGQCNAMGSRLFSNTTNLLGGHVFENPDHRGKVADILKIDESVIPQEASWSYDRILEGIHNGEIKGLWIIATNTAHSWINQKKAKDALSKLDFLVVQDMYSTTETVDYADLYLPVAGWGEKEGTFINSERRIGRHRKVSKSPGQALSDFSIFRLIASAWGCGEMFASWSSPEKVFSLMKELSRNQPCDITGIEDYAMLEREEGIQWPLPEGEELKAKERRLFEDGKFYHPDQKAKFLFAEPTEVAEQTSEEFPFIMLTGRGSSSQWHTLTRTGKSDVLNKLAPKEAYVEIHPDDADKLFIKAHSEVLIKTTRAEMKAYAFVTPTVRPGQIFVPMHFAKSNQLTCASFDPYSRQPSYKWSAANVEPA